MKKFLVLLLLLTGCRQSELNNNFFDLSECTPLTGSEILSDVELWNPQSILAVKEGVIIDDHIDSHLLIYYKDLNNPSPQYLAPKGTGPFEFINTRITYYNHITDRLFIYDSQLKRTTEFDVTTTGIVTDTTTMRQVNLYSVNGHDVMPVTDGFIMGGPLDGKPFLLTDSTGESVEPFGSYPQDAANISDPYSLGLIFQNRIITNPQGSRLAAASPFCDWMSFYEIEDGKPTLLKEYYSFPPNITASKPDANTTSLNFGDDTLQTYSCMSATENFVYVLYDGRTQKEIEQDKNVSRYILKFDWDGDYIEGYRIGERIYCFSVSRDDSRLFGLVDLGDENGEDNIIVKEYTLNSKK